jgi:hypothetical protein
MSSTGVHFVSPPGEVSSEDRLRHIAIQATAVMLHGWFEDEEPNADEAQQMVSAVMNALLKNQTTT